MVIKRLNAILILYVAARLLLHWIHLAGIPSSDGRPKISGHLSIGHRAFNQSLLIDAFTHVAIQKSRTIFGKSLTSKRLEHVIGNRLKKRG
tara:strand:+ start:539 stop:811 length:273 start_codon:yes stop_codon:yes gene_type:complete